MESTYDGGVLEVSINGGSTWVDVLDAGGSFDQRRAMIDYQHLLSTAPSGQANINRAFTTYRRVSVNLNALIGQNNVRSGSEKPTTRASPMLVQTS